MNKHSIELSEEQRERLEHVIKAGQVPARQIMHAHVLLKADSGPKGPNWSDERIHEAFGVSAATIWRIRCRFEESGLEDALLRRVQPERPEKRKIAGEQEAHLIALTCSPAPKATNAGRCGCWPITWCNWAMSIPSVIKRCGKC